MNEKKKLTGDDFPIDVPETVKVAFSRDPWSVVRREMPELVEYLELKKCNFTLDYSEVTQKIMLKRKVENYI